MESNSYEKQGGGGAIIFDSSLQARRTSVSELASLLPVLALPEEAGREYGRIRADLESRGASIGNNDLWIAAHAMVENLVLVTDNEREFRPNNDLKIENWATRK